MHDIDSLPLVMEPEFFHSFLAGGGSSELKQRLVIIDLCPERSYHQRHIPGAINVQPHLLNSGIPPARGKLPTLSQLESLFSTLGFTGKEHFVVYDDEGGGWAGRFIWTLDVIGHHSYSYLNGGIHAWLHEGHPTESVANERAPSVISLSIDDSVIASKDYILTMLNSPEVVIWDARSPQEYSGEKAMALKAGHIPGAVNFEWTRAMDPARNYRIKDGLTTELATLGITRDKEIITHCQAHHRSGFTYLVAKALGFTRIKAYDGSWSEWGNMPDTPVEQ